MSDADKLKDQTAQNSPTVTGRFPRRYVGLNTTGEFNRILVIAQDQLNLDMAWFVVTEGERTLLCFATPTTL